MLLRFWGTRGSIPTPGPRTVRYGGNTSCVELRSAAGTLVVLDCGTGAHELGHSLAAHGKPIRGHLLISHTHWDHIQGFPFFRPLFDPANEWDIYAPLGFEQSLRETLAGQMQYTYFPVSLDELGARIRFHQLVEGGFEVEEIKVHTQYLNHPALALGYRLEADGVVAAYACDHEPYSPHLAGGEGELTPQDRRHANFLRDADIAIHDAQYTASEYGTKQGWGHSTVEYAVEIGRTARVRRLALTHHDPLHDDDTLDRIASHARAAAKTDTMEVFAAREGLTLELLGAAGSPAAHADLPRARVESAASALAAQAVLLGIADPKLAARLQEAVAGGGVQVILAADGSAVSRRAAIEPPALAILQDELPPSGGGELCRQLREAGLAPATPVIIVCDSKADRSRDEANGVSDRLVTPFTNIYARARIRAWLLRTALRWATPPIPADEEARLAALHALNILDTAPEEKFDRLTRYAAEMFDVPIVLVSLIDRDRQWFKSAQGISAQETPRDLSFCAHAIADKAPLVVTDTLTDDRFADNPLVTGEPHMRFYAGSPLILPNGSCVGTVCAIDTRPRQLDDVGLRLLREIGNQVTALLTDRGID
ncbi:MAG: GAF domain-containing protein [Alphaproteobacteria bacterium]|nr:GAF domain-containing protein [Alphaproteobacteria bacterium]